MQIKKYKIDLMRAVLAINIFGLLTLLSLGSQLFISQLLKFTAATAIFIIIYRCPEMWYEMTTIIYFTSLLTLLINMKMASSMKRWVNIASISVQFSQFAKIAVLLMTSKILAEYRANLSFKRKLYMILIALAAVFVPTLLILKQPNLGTASVIAIAGISIIWIQCGINRKLLAFGLVTCLSLMPIFWNNLLPYQQNRILAFLNPTQDPKGSSYQTIQSIIAVGSGGVIGSKGLQNNLGFVPENHTDFLFSCFAEKTGFFMTILLVVLIFFASFRLIDIGSRLHDKFKQLFCFGYMSLWITEATFNIGMNIGIVPVIGVPLPFFSYGGSCLLAYAIGLAILMNMLKTK